MLSRHPTAAGGRLEPRHVDLRPFVLLAGDTARVIPGGLTRVALEPGRAGREQLARGRRQGHVGAVVSRPPLVGVSTSEVRRATDHSVVPQGEPSRRELALGERYLDAVRSAGGLPVILTPVHGSAIDPLLERLDARLPLGRPRPAPVRLWRGGARAARPDRAGARPVRARARAAGGPPRHAGARHLPRRAGAERRARRHPAPAPSRPVRRGRAPPAGGRPPDDARREARARQPPRQADGPHRGRRELLPPSGARDARPRAARRRQGGRRHRRGHRERRQGLRVRSPVARRVPRRDARALRPLRGARPGGRRALRRRADERPEGHELAARMGGLAGRSRAPGLDGRDRGGGHAPRPRALGARAPARRPAARAQHRAHAKDERRDALVHARAGGRHPYRRSRRGSASWPRSARQARRRSSPRSGCARRWPARTRSRSGEDTEVSESARYQALYDKMRELARREPTFALHVHVGVPDPELAMRAADRMRAHLPLILAAIRATRPTGAAATAAWRRSARRSSRAFRARASRAASAATRPTPRRSTSCCAPTLFPEPTFIWWDVRLQPRFGTVEVRIADAQTTVADTAGSRR